MGIGLAALGWIIWRFVQSGALGLLGKVPAGPWIIGGSVAAAACAYAGALCVLAYAWWRLLAGLSASVPAPAATMATWAASQYGRYIPGNVAHLALRHAWSRRHAIPHTVLGMAALIEACLLLFVGLVIALVGAGETGPFGADARALLALLVAGLLAGLGGLHVLRRRGGVRKWVPPPTPPGMLAVAIACYVAFFAITATVLYGLAALLGASISWADLLVAGTASWAAGFVVIGAPAGIGVREAAFVALTGGMIGEERALLLIALYRVVTFLGDTLLFAAAALALRRLSRSSGTAGLGADDG
ncbi:MAG: flippase-like domain-containing protein [Xanthomonadales bacterium]|nr:flippase-like domain-containing protein [Xanthomonadales bacterium]